MSLQDDFKGALASWASGVSVVTTNADGMLYGLTVSSFTSLSLDPPLVLVCLANANRLPAMILDAGGFAPGEAPLGFGRSRRVLGSTGRRGYVPPSTRLF